MDKVKKISRARGFTLQEMVIVCAIVVILSTSIYLMFANGRKLFNLQNYTAIAENQALKASLIMQRELREARAPEGLNLQAIEEANTQSIIFYADITEEATNNREEKIEYLLHDGYLLKGIAYWNPATGTYNDLPDLSQYHPSQTPSSSPRTSSFAPTPSQSTSRSPSPTPATSITPSGFVLAPKGLDFIKEIWRVLHLATAQAQTPSTTDIPCFGVCPDDNPDCLLCSPDHYIRVMAQYVVNTTNPIFTYYDQNYTGSENPMSYPINLGAIKVIRAHLEIDPNPGRPPASYKHDITIQFRNPIL